MVSDVKLIDVNKYSLTLKGGTTTEFFRRTGCKIERRDQDEEDYVPSCCTKRCRSFLFSV